MRLRITVGEEVTEADFEDGLVSVGSGVEDGIQVGGLRDRHLELRIEGDRLMVVCAETFTVDEVLSPSRVPRLVLPGERIGLIDGVSLCQIAEAPRGEAATSAVLKHLLFDFGEPDQVRCASLTALTGLDVGRRYPVVGDEVDVGRGERVAVRIRDRAVSRRHARLIRTGTGYSVEDLETPNGVFVNGRRVQGQTELKDGDILELGRSILRFQAAAPPAVPDAAPAGDPSVPLEAHGCVTEGPAAPEATTLDESPSTLPRRRAWVEGVLIGVGVCLAVAGVAFTYRMV